MRENDAHARGERGQIDPSEPRRYFADKCRAYHENGELVLFNTRTARLAKVDPRLPILLNASNGGTREEVLAAVKDQMDPQVAAAMLDEVAEYFTTDSAEPAVAPARPLGQEKITFLAANLMHDCTMACKYCFVDQGQHWRLSKDTKCPPAMSQEVADAALDLLFRECGDVGSVTVYFSGGEPMMNFPILRHAVLQAEKIAADKGKRAFFGMSSNGTIMTEEMAQFIAAHRISTQISLDGPPEVQNAARPMKDGSDSFDLVAGNLKLLKDAGFNAGLAAVCHKRNLRVSDTFNYLKQFTPSGIQITMAQSNHDSEWGFSEEDLPRIAQEARLQFDEVFNGIAECKMVPSITIWKFIGSVRSGSARPVPCGAGRNTLCVSPDGAIYPCGQFAGHLEFKLGDVARPEGWRDRAKSLELLNAPTSGPCLTCWGKSLCAGSCPIERWYRDKNQPLAPHPAHCQFYLAYLDEALRLLARVRTADDATAENFTKLYEQYILRAKHEPDDKEETEGR